MDTKISVTNLISKDILEGLEQLLLYVYDLAEVGNSTDLDSNYTFGTNLYGKLLPAIQQYAKDCIGVEDFSGHGRAILKLVDSPTYLRFINISPSDYRRKKGNNNIIDIFNLSEEVQPNYDLFDNQTVIDKPLFGFFFFNKSPEPEALPYIRLQIFDQFWNLQDEWSSDKIQDGISLTIDESAKALPEAKPLVSGNKQLTPIKPVIPDIKKDL